MRWIAILPVLAALVLAACGDNAKTTTVVNNTTTVTQTETIEATTSRPPEHFEFFQSPSKNIGCAATEADVTQVRCDIRNHSWKSPPKPADCDVDYGGGLSIQAGSTAHFVCAGDTTLNNGPILQYGQTNKIGLISCRSTVAGITCVDDETGRGFFLSRERYKLL